jgi:heme-degrading monooxygenase HmoA
MPALVPATHDQTVLHLRLNLIAAGPPVLDECVGYIRSELGPAVERQPGSLGISLLISPRLGVAALESFWASAQALRAGEQATASLRAALAGRVGVSMTDEQYRILVFERRAPLRGGEAVRLTRMKAKPSAVEDVTEAFGDSAVPWLAETPGFRAALLFVDPDSGQLISQTVWRGPQARAASPSTAAVIQADVLNAADCVIRAVEDYSLVFSSARKP